MTCVYRGRMPRHATSFLPAVLLVLGTALLAGCSSNRVPAPVDLGDLRLEADLPDDYAPHEDAPLPAPSCVDALELLGPAGAARDEGLLLARVAPGAACPDEEAVNGRFPSWGAAEQLPAQVEPVELAIGNAYRFSVRYGHCTNDCRYDERPVTFVELPDGSTFFAIGYGVSPDLYEQMVDSLRRAGDTASSQPRRDLGHPA